MNTMVSARAIETAMPIDLHTRGARLRGKPANAGDPIFAAIERHRQLEAAFSDAARIADHAGTPYPDQAERDAAVKAAGDAVEKAACELLDIEPTTMPGLIALLQYAADYERSNGWPTDLESEEFPEGGQAFGLPWSFFLYRHVAAALGKIAAVGDGAAKGAQATERSTSAPRSARCPVEILALEYEPIAGAIIAVDATRGDTLPRGEDMRDALDDRREAIVHSASFAQATSIEGAAFQIALALTDLDCIMGGAAFTVPAHRDEIERRAIRTIKLVADCLRGLGATLPPHVAEYYSGGYDHAGLIRAALRFAAQK